MNLTFDVECYANYFLAKFMDRDTGKFYSFAMYNDVPDHFKNELAALLRYNTIYTFNGLNYDMPIVTLYLTGSMNIELKKASDNIIQNRLMPWVFYSRYNLEDPKYDHIDLIQPAFGTASLKVYGARLGSKKLQELPIHHNNIIMPFQTPILDMYCGNDNIVTDDLACDLDEAIELRIRLSEEYGIDLRSKSDAQIAEQVIKSEYQKVTGEKLKKPSAKKSYKYFAPSFVYFATEQLQDLYNTCANVDFNISEKGAVMMPPELNKQISIGDKKYKMGIGGLHSVDKGGSYYSCGDYELYDIDVASYYPFIILNSGFEPKHIGSLFTDIYKKIVYDRLTAKRAGNKVVADSLKIVINGLFGKFGSRYSVVYSPDLMFHTTVTGQLCLFMLIEQFAISSIQVISANTDGITVRVHKSQKEHLDNLVKWWEGATGFEMEYTPYKSIHHRDVNNYIAVMEDGDMKGKGIFASDSIRKNPANSIVRDAVMAYIKDKTSPAETITTCTDVTKFLTVKKVTGGAVKDDVPLGATVRWYRSKDTLTALNYAKNGNQVGGSECGMPMMDLPEPGVMPLDLDYYWYDQEVHKVLEQIGMVKL